MNNSVYNIDLMETINSIAKIKDTDRRIKAVNGTINLIVIKHSNELQKVTKANEKAFREDLEKFKFAVDSRFHDVELPHDVVEKVVESSLERFITDTPIDEPINEVVDDEPIFKGKLITHKFN